MFTSIALWSHSLVAALFGGLSIWGARQSAKDSVKLAMSIACALTACWGLIVALFGHSSILSQLGEAGRNLGWLCYMYSFWRQGGGNSRSIGMQTLYATLATVVVLCFVASLVPSLIIGSPRLLQAAFFASIILDLMMVIGALMLVHNLYTAATLDGRSALRLPMIALAIIWIYDLNIFTISYLAGGWSYELMSLRGGAVALTAPLLALSMVQTQRSAIRLSRSATFQSLSLVAIGGYLIIMVVVSSLLEVVAADYARLAQVGFVFGSSVIALLVLPTPQFRAWFRVKLSKHLFQHRYDYRAEWLRFTDTIGRPGQDAEALEVRIIRAVADITESPGGALLIPDDTGALIVQAKWNWVGNEMPVQAGSAAAARFYANSGRITELDFLRRELDPDAEEAHAVPEWLLQDPSAWVMVPLCHFDRLSGIVLLQRPLLDRTLDWEDFDLLRVVGRQLASYIAEARGQEALADVQQFDEFNRRFAFIMHDIKNLVSQLSLVTRNAEKHAGNPDFQADMIATLKSSTARMNDMLARLSQHNKVKTSDPAANKIGPMIEQVAAAKRMAHPIVISGALDLYAVVDPPRLVQALSHLVQNAVDASDANDPVTINVRHISDECAIEVTDRGKGMSTHFIRHSLFKPFSSSKEGGFGIGAFEARSLIAAMNGRLDVTSREEEGTTFRIILPLARGPQFNLEYTLSEAKAA